MKKTQIYSLIGLISILILSHPSSVYSSTIVMQANWGSDWRPHGAFLDEILFKFFIYPDEPLVGLLNGSVDAFGERVSGPFDGTFLTKFVNNPSIGVTFTQGNNFRVLPLNCERFPTNITGYRRAMAYGLDKYQVCAETQDILGYPLDSYIPTAFTDWEIENQLPDYFYEADFVKGNASLENAGFKDLDGDGWREYDVNDNGIWDPGTDLNETDCAIELWSTASYDPTIIACNKTAEGLKQMGMQATVVEKDFMTIIDDVMLGNHWVASWTMSVDINNPSKSLYEWFRTNASWSDYSHFSNNTIDVILDNLIEATSIEEVKQYTQEANTLLAFEQPMLVAYNYVNVNAFRTDKFEGFFEMTGIGSSSYENWANLIKVHLKPSEGGPYGGTFNYCLREAMDSLNCLLEQYYIEEPVFKNVYERLWNIDPITLNPMPGLAYNWDITDTTAGSGFLDGQNYTFYLYENASWHDGQPVTSDDVKYSFETVWPNSSEYGHQVTNIYRIDTPDAHTVSIYTNESSFSEWVDATSLYILPKHIWEIHGPHFSAWAPTSASDLTGSGPYMWNYYNPGENISLLRYDDWRWDVRDIPEFTCPEQTCPEQTCPECPPPETVLVTDEKTKTIVKTVCPEETTTTQSEGTQEIPGITPGLELHSTITVITILGVTTIILRRRKK